jgi:hypothetical protein
MRIAARRDKNEPEIIEALIAIGCKVLQLSQEGINDLAVYRLNRWYMIEVKTATGKLTEVQKKWPEEIGPDAIPIVRSVEDAFKAIGAEVTQ